MSTEVPDPIFILWKEEETFHSLLFTNTLGEEQLLTGTERGQALTWDLRSGRTSSAVIPLSTGPSTSLSLHSLNKSLVTQNKNGLVKIWNVQNNHWVCKNEMKLNYFGFCKIDVSDDLGGILVCAKEKSEIEVFNVESLKKIAVFQHRESSKVGEVMACKVFNRGGNLFLITAFESGDIATWDFNTMKIISQLKVTGDDCPMAFDYDEVHGKGICGSNSDKVVIFKTDEQMQLSKRHEFLMKSEGVSCVRIRPDRKVVAVGSWDGKVRLFASKTCRPLACFTNHKSAILDMAFCPYRAVSHDSKHLLAASSKDGKISLLDVSL